MLPHGLKKKFTAELRLSYVLQNIILLIYDDCSSLPPPEMMKDVSCNPRLAFHSHTRCVWWTVLMDGFVLEFSLWMIV